MDLSSLVILITVFTALQFFTLLTLCAFFYKLREKEREAEIKVFFTMWQSYIESVQGILKELESGHIHDEPN